MKLPDYSTLMEKAKTAEIDNWKAWGKEFSNKLREQGVSQETIDGIELFDAGESVRAPFRSTKGIIPTACFHFAQGIALAKWLVEHYRGDQSPVFRENANRLQVLLLTLNQVEIAPDVAKGRKFRAGRSKDAKSVTTKYIERLVDLYPDKSTKELHKIALAEADTDSSPFGREVDELWNTAENKTMLFKTFSNKVSALKNPGSR